MFPRPIIADFWPNHIVHQKLEKYLTADMAGKLNAIDREGYSHAEGLPLKWAIIEAEPDPDARYGGAVWITYQ